MRDELCVCRERRSAFPTNTERLIVVLITLMNVGDETFVGVFNCVSPNSNRGP